MNQKEKSKILKNRAAALAREFEPPRTAEDYLELVVFGLASETYAIEGSFVTEIRPLKELTPLPCTPPFVLGVINQRGQILSILDLKKFFDLPTIGLPDLNKVIALRMNDMEFGILADVVVGMRDVLIEEIHPPPPTLKGIQAQYLKGVTQNGMIVLDGTKILSDRKIVVHEEVGTGT